jgi:hypothetical protein
VERSVGEGGLQSFAWCHRPPYPREIGDKSLWFWGPSVRSDRVQELHAYHLTWTSIDLRLFYWSCARTLLI